MQVSFVDHSGCGLGVAVGLVELGHRVDYVGPEPWPGDVATETDRLTHELVARFFGARAVAPDADADLLVLWDGVADKLHAMERGEHLEARCDLGHPLRLTLNPLIYPVRLEQWVGWAESARHTVVVDFSDRSGPREPAFTMLSRATLLTRELPTAEQGGVWQALPFLYNLAVLWLEKARPESEWRVPEAQRRRVRDWVFCGTVEHPRYGDDRRQRLAEVRAQWPSLRGHVATAIPFVEVLTLLQSSRMGLDLPGAGELCCRLHEVLALGVPVLRPWPSGIVLPPGIEKAIVVDPLGNDVPGSGAVRDVYERCYAPRVAAAAMLAALRRAGNGAMCAR